MMKTRKDVWNEGDRDRFYEALGNGGEIEVRVWSWDKEFWWDGGHVFVFNRKLW